jgi:hypothetical protein
MNPTQAAGLLGRSIGKAITADDDLNLMPGPWFIKVDVEEREAESEECLPEGAVPRPPLLIFTAYPADQEGETRAIDAWIPREILSSKHAKRLLELAAAEMAERLRGSLLRGAKISFANRTIKPVEA